MPIRTIHVGAWSRGRAHMGPMMKSGHFQPVALVDVRDDYLEQGRELCKLPKEACHHTLTAALDRHDCDAVAVVTPVTIHTPFILEALRAGKHVMVEKPFCVSLAEAKEAVNLADTKKVALLVTQNDRLAPAYRTLRRLVADEVYGPAGYALLSHHKPRRGPYNMSPHMHLWQQGIHQLDTLLAVVQNPIRHVMGVSVEPGWGTWPTPSLAHAVIEFEGGVTASYIGTSQARHNDVQFIVACRDGALTTTGQFTSATLQLRVGTDVTPVESDAAPNGMTPEEQITEMFYRQISKGESNEITGRNNLKSMALVDAIVRSSETHSVTTLDL